ncbi:hypothetical protein ACFCYB_03250, partial [Streptomyces sp. NPDC056309]
MDAGGPRVHPEPADPRGPAPNAGLRPKHTGGAHDLGARFFRAVVDDLRGHNHDKPPLPNRDALPTERPAGDWLGDDHEPWQEPSPQQVRPLKDAPGKPVEDG